MATAVITREGMTVDLVVWQHFGRQDDGLVERTFELNPDVADLGEILPVGTVLELPELSATTPQLIETVRLF